MKINYPLASDTWDNKEIEAINKVIEVCLRQKCRKLKHTRAGACD